MRADIQQGAHRPILSAGLLVGLRAALRVTVRPAIEDAVIAGFHAGTAIIDADRTQSKFQKFAHRRRPCRHPVLEAEIIDCRQLTGRQHDLKSLSTQLVHRMYPKLDN